MGVGSVPVRLNRRACVRQLAGLTRTGIGLLAGLGAPASPSTHAQEPPATTVPAFPPTSAPLPTSTLVPLPARTPRPVPPESISLTTPDRVAHLLTLAGHTDSIWGVAVSTDGQTVASASSDATARLWR